MSTSTNGKLKDGRQLGRIDAYAKHWQKDLKTDTKVRSYHPFGVTISDVDGYCICRRTPKTAMPITKMS
jgi:hypothetical protein